MFDRNSYPHKSVDLAIDTNGWVECTPTQPEAIGNILSSHDEVHFTNGIPKDWVLHVFYWYQSCHWYIPMDK